MTQQQIKDNGNTHIAANDIVSVELSRQEIRDIIVALDLLSARLAPDFNKESMNASTENPDSDYGVYYRFRQERSGMEKKRNMHDIMIDLDHLIIKLTSR